MEKNFKDSSFSSKEELVYAFTVVLINCPIHRREWVETRAQGTRSDASKGAEVHHCSPEDLLGHLDSPEVVLEELFASLGLHIPNPRLSLHQANQGHLCNRHTLRATWGTGQRSPAWAD